MLGLALTITGILDNGNNSRYCKSIVIAKYHSISLNIPAIAETRRQSRSTNKPSSLLAHSHHPQPARALLMQKLSTLPLSDVVYLKTCIDATDPLQR